MSNVYDLAEFKKRKKQQKLINFYQKYKSINPLISISITFTMIWMFFSLKSALLILGVIVLVPVIFSKNKEQEEVQTNSVTYSSISKHH